MTRTEALLIRLDQPTKERLAAFAKDRDLSMSWIAAEAIKQYLDKEVQP